MRPIKFSYILQHEETGYIIEQFFTMEEIEGSNFLVQLKDKFRLYNIVYRRQSTGLQDKNGKWIYEGDIVISLTSDTYGYDKGTIFEIGYDDTELCFYAYYHGDRGSRKQRVTSTKKYEIIGTIYENPELLSNN